MAEFLSELWHFFPRRFPVLLMVATLSALSEGLALLMLYPFLTVLVHGAGGGGRLMDVMATGLWWVHLYPTIPVLSVLIVLVACAQYAIRLMQIWLSADMQGRYLSLIRQELFDVFLKARWSFFVSIHSGELTNALTLETMRSLFVFQSFVQLIPAVANAVILLVVACFVSLRATVSLVLLAGVLGIASYRMFRRGASVGQSLSDLNEGFASWTTDVLANMKFFKATASEAVAQARYAVLAQAIAGPLAWAALTPQVMRTIVEFGATMLFIGFVVLGTTVLHMDFLRIVVILGIFVRLLPRLAATQEGVQSLSAYLPSIGRVRSLRRRADAAAERIGPVPGGMAQPSAPAPGPVGISVRNLAVRYAGRAALDGVSLDIPPGQIIAIVGPSGAGKTTLIDCLLGLIDPEQGEIVIDGSPLREIALAAWRQTIAYQSQDPVMLSGSLRENITWTAREVPEAALDEAVGKAGIAAFIATLPLGYDSEVGERGARLSGGQRQRIGLARALLSRKRLLILDEATSALDPATEAGVIQNIRRLAGEMTVVMVTHRLATAQAADRIYVMEAGRVVESGNWAELMGRDGAFRQLWQHQTERANLPTPDGAGVNAPSIAGSSDAAMPA